MNLKYNMDIEKRATSQIHQNIRSLKNTRDFRHNRLLYHLVTCIHLARECNSYLRALHRKKKEKEGFLFFFELSENRFFHVNVLCYELRRRPISRYRDR